MAQNKLVIGQRDASGNSLKQAAFTGGIKNDTWYNVMLSINGLTATLVVNNTNIFSYVFQPTVIDGWSYGLNWGLAGFGSNKSRGAIDNITVQVLPPLTDKVRTTDFTTSTPTAPSAGSTWASPTSRRSRRSS